MYSYEYLPNVDSKGIDLINERLVKPYLRTDEICFNDLPSNLTDMFEDDVFKDWIVDHHENDYEDMDDFLEMLVGEDHLFVFDYEKVQRMVGLIETFVKSLKVDCKLKEMNKDFRNEPKTYDECIDMAVDDEDMFELQEQFLVREYEKTHGVKCVLKNGMWVPEK